MAISQRRRAAWSFAGICTLIGLVRSSRSWEKVGATMASVCHRNPKSYSCFQGHHGIVACNSIGFDASQKNPSFSAILLFDSHLALQKDATIQAILRHHPPRRSRSFICYANIRGCIYPTFPKPNVAWKGELLHANLRLRDLRKQTSVEFCWSSGQPILQASEK